MMKSEQEKKLNAWIVDEVCVQLTPTSRPSDAETIAQKILSKWDPDGKSPELVEALATAHLIKVSLIVGQEVYNWPRTIREDIDGELADEIRQMVRTTMRNGCSPARSNPRSR
jgi:hypothetical protein